MLRLGLDLGLGLGLRLGLGLGNRLLKEECVLIMDLIFLSDVGSLQLS